MSDVTLFCGFCRRVVVVVAAKQNRQAGQDTRGYTRSPPLFAKPLFDGENGEEPLFSPRFPLPPPFWKRPSRGRRLYVLFMRPNCEISSRMAQIEVAHEHLPEAEGDQPSHMCSANESVHAGAEWSSKDTETTATTSIQLKTRNCV